MKMYLVHCAIGLQLLQNQALSLPLSFHFGLVVISLQFPNHPHLLCLLLEFVPSPSSCASVVLSALLRFIAFLMIALLLYFVLFSSELVKRMVQKLSRGPFDSPCRVLMMHMWFGKMMHEMPSIPCHVPRFERS